jgi:hypothetical protein
MIIAKMSGAASRVIPTLADGCEECMGGEIASLLSRRTGTHEFSPLQ